MASARTAVAPEQRAALVLERERVLGTVTTTADLSDDEEFVRLRALICESGTDCLRHFGNGYTHEGGLALQQNPDEFAALCLFLKQQGPFTTYLEIGSASGGTGLILSRQLGFDLFASIDDGNHPRAAEQVANLGGIQGFRQYVGDSHSPGARTFLEDTLAGAPLDVAFVDGDHSEEGAWQDIEMVRPFCHPGTLLVLHDTKACHGVEVAWLRVIREGIVTPVAEFFGNHKPLGIGVGRIN
ncbi:MAG: hypothetical protein NVSMB32_15310 [Actinomycetota bacterium]